MVFWAIHKLAQILTNYLWAKWPVSQYFYIPLPIYVPKNLRVMTASTPHRHIKKRLMKTVGAHTPCSCGYMQDGGLYFHIKDYQGNVRVVLNQANQPVEVNSYYPYGGLMASTTTEGTQPYKYSTKELDRENGLDWYDNKARMYDPTIGRTPTLDPMAEKYYSMSPYVWCGANPIMILDSTGMVWTYINGKEITDHSQINVYIFYDPYSFASQSEAMYKRAEEKYGKRHVAMSNAVTEKEFSTDWKNMASEQIIEVDLNYHGDNQTLMLKSVKDEYITATGDGLSHKSGKKALNVQNLENPTGNISNATLNINSCKSNNITQYPLKGNKKTLMRAFYDTFNFKSVRGTSAGVSYNWFTKMPEPQYFWQHWDYMGENHGPQLRLDFTNTIYFRTGGMR